MDNPFTPAFFPVSSNNDSDMPVKHSDHGAKKRAIQRKRKNRQVKRSKRLNRR